MTDEFGLLCQRVDCEHTAASHLDGGCDWCACPSFLHPDYDDEPEHRIAAA